MKRIFKYELKLEDEQEIEMPDGADIMTVVAKAEFPYRNNPKHSKICLWAMADEDKHKTKRHIMFICTGQRIESDLRLKYIATICFEDGAVNHVFENVRI